MAHLLNCRRHNKSGCPVLRVLCEGRVARKSGHRRVHGIGSINTRPCKNRKDGAPTVSKWKRDQTLKAWATRPFCGRCKKVPLGLLQQETPRLSRFVLGVGRARVHSCRKVPQTRPALAAEGRSPAPWIENWCTSRLSPHFPRVGHPPDTVI